MTTIDILGPWLLCLREGVLRRASRYTHFSPHLRFPITFRDYCEAELEGVLNPTGIMSGQAPGPRSRVMDLSRWICPT